MILAFPIYPAGVINLERRRCVKEKLAIEDIVNLFYTNRRQAEIANIHPSTLCIAINNPDWTSSKKHMQ